MGATARRLLREARRHAGLSQAELSRRAGVPRSVVNAYERSARDPGVDALEALLRAADSELALRRRPPIDEDRAARELAHALRLAAALPQPGRRPLRYPALVARR